jgi:hypothetical protein
MDYKNNLVVTHVGILLSSGLPFFTPLAFRGWKVTTRLANGNYT